MSDGGGTGGGSGNRAALVAVALVAALAIGAGLVLLLGDDGSGDGTQDVSTGSTLLTTTEAGFSLAEGEIFLEPAGSAGPDSFAGEVFSSPTTTIPSSPTTVTPPAPPPTGPRTVSAVAGDRPALYGGSRNSARCDKAAQLQFLMEHPDKAAAFVDALNADPSLTWSGGSSVTVAQLGAYFDELTPMVLASDTRVTNHGYRDGRPTPRQAVLQAGSAVLVDAYGVPRARCECGNPLTAPLPVQVAPVYTGARWAGFDPATIIVVNQTTVIIETFVLVDVNTGEEFTRPAGTDGGTDALQEASVWQIDLSATKAEADSFNTTSIDWSGQLTIADDGTVSGTAQGTWTFDGDCYASSGEVQSTSSSRGTLTVTLTGQVVTTELGRFVSIEPTYGDFVIDSYVGDPPGAVCEQDIYDNVESWVAPSFTTLEQLQAEGDTVSAPYESGGFTGEVTLTPIG